MHRAGSWLHSMVARRVACRGSASRPPRNRSSRCASRSRICSGDEQGRPGPPPARSPAAARSSWRQNSRTGASAAAGPLPEERAAHRSRQRSPARTRARPAIRSSSRLVTSTVRLGQARSTPASSGAASIRCSKLSSTSSIACRRRGGRSPRPPAACSALVSTSRGSLSGGQRHPPGAVREASTASPASCDGKPCLAVPPGPVTVSSLLSATAVRRPASSSRSGPRKERRRLRQVGGFRLRSGGKRRRRAGTAASGRPGPSAGGPQVGQRSRGRRRAPGCAPRSPPGRRGAQAAMRAATWTSMPT